MASEEERAKIMAEYLSGANGGDDEEEFREDDEDEDDDGGEAEADFPVLKGRLKIDDESRLVYLGFWCMRTQLGVQMQQHATKFKLKSVDKISWTNLHKPPNDVPIKMNGFFLTDENDAVQPHRKIKERGVEISFKKSRTTPKRYSVNGHGENDFGHFYITGIYNTGKSINPKHLMQCNKQYGVSSQEDDDGYDTDDGADAEELNGLEDEATMSIEELRKKYYSGAGGNGGSTVAATTTDDGDAKPPAAKKPKLELPPQDDEDDDCGF